MLSLGKALNPWMFAAVLFAVLIIAAVVSSRRVVRLRDGLIQSDVLNEPAG